MIYEQSVVCPVPECPWSARVEIEQGDDLTIGWRLGVVDDALTAERVEHVRERHVHAVGSDRSGALMTCGCWWEIPPGSERGRPATCPVHGPVFADTMNVPEPGDGGPPAWIPSVVVSATEEF